ncbi:MAG: hypothetical protein J6A08_00780 [Lachnospiraceae bacterium]|nr:hypothetical protein [Lachnospiraceae bacterium]
MKMDIIIPVSYNDCFKLRDNINYIKNFITADKIVIIGCEKVRLAIPELWTDTVSFINEEDLISLSDVTSYFYKIVESSSSKPTWYYQQFLKLYYAAFTKNEYYLAWDADTALVKRCSFFDSVTGRPYFDMKTEYHAPYFSTINTLFPDVDKIAKGSFVSEHMVFKKQYVLEMIREIESNNKIPGTVFWEKIFNAAKIEDLKSTASFSEFETYGSWVLTRYPDTYILREWSSLRHAVNYYSSMKEALKDQYFLSKEYDAISIEYGHSDTQYVMSPLCILFWNPLFKLLWKPSHLMHFLHDRGLAYWPGEKEAYRTKKQ